MHYVIGASMPSMLRESTDSLNNVIHYLASRSDPTGHGGLSRLRKATYRLMPLLSEGWVSLSTPLCIHLCCQTYHHVLRFQMIHTSAGACILKVFEIVCQLGSRRSPIVFAFI